MALGKPVMRRQIFWIGLANEFVVIGSFEQQPTAVGTGRRQPAGE